MLKMIVRTCKWHHNNICRCPQPVKKAWNVDEYHQLHQTGQNLLQDLNTVLNDLEAGSSCDTVIGDVPGTNVPLALTKLCSLLQSFNKYLFKKKHKPATDILVFLHCYKGWSAQLGN